nr:hypothetical protein [Tanacetum cinerariifolium]
MAFSSSSSSSDNGVPSCSKACSKAYDQLHSQYDKLTNEFRKYQIDVLSYQAEQEGDDLKLKLDKFQSSSRNLIELLASQTNDKHGLGYFSSESDSESLYPSSFSDRMQPSGGYHVVPSPITGNFMPLKPDLVFHTAPIAVETDHSAFTVKLSPCEPTQDLSHISRPSAPIIEEWVSDSKDESETTALQITPSFVQSTKQMKPPRHYVQPVETSIPVATPKPTSPKSNRIGKRKNRKTCFVCKSVDHLIKDYDYHAKIKAQPTPRNYAHKGNHKQYASLTHKKLQNHMAPTAVLTQSKPVFNTAVRPVSPDVPKIMDETSPILKTFVTGLENQLNLKVKVIRSDNGTEFKTSNLNQFYELKGIKKEFSVPRTPQQNGIAKRKNRTLIEAARTMLADSLLPIPFWDEAVNTTCYVQNRVLVTKPHNKTPYELLHGRTPSIGFMRPFDCHVTILNTLDPLGKFKGKVDEGFLVGYSINSKAFRVFNSRTRIIQKTLHVNFLENKPNITGTGPTWLFDIDSLTRTMNYQPFTAGNQSNPSAGFQETFDADKAREEANQQYMLFPMWSNGSSNPQNKEGDAAFNGKEHDAEKPESAVNLSPSSSALSGEQDDMTKKKDKEKSHVEYFIGNRDLNADFEDYSKDSSNDVSVAGPIVIAYSDHENVGAEADFNNLETSITVSPILTTRTHKAHLISQIIGDLSSTTQTRSMTRVIKDQYGLSQIFNDDFYTCMFACFLLQEEPKRVHQALKDPSWIEAMQEELLQFKIKKVWILVDLPNGKRAIGTKWVYRNKKDERGIVVRNKVRLVAQGHTQEEGIDYEEVFAPVARIEAIRLFLAYASFMGFMVYQIDVKSAFLYRTIEEEVYVCQPLGFEDLIILTKSIKWSRHFMVYIRLLELADERQVSDEFNRRTYIFLGLQVKQKKDGMFINQDKYVAEILKKFGLTEGKSASTPIDTEKPLLKDPDGEDVDVHIYRSMIGSLMYLTSSRPDIMFAFWKIVAVKSSNDVTRLQALVDKKKVVVTEAAIRDALCLDDAEGVDCLPNEEIFTELARMSYEKPSTKLTFYKAFFSSQWKFLIRTILQSMSAKRTSWNEFSSAMASAMICLSTGHKFNFSKYIFDSLVRNVDSSSKFYMYPRVGKGCFGVKTPLFEGMLVAKEPEKQGDAEEQGTDDNAAEEPNTAVLKDDLKNQSISSPTPPPQQPQDIPSTSQAQSPHPQPQSPTPSQPQEIIKLKTRVKKLERDNKGRMIDELDRDEGAVLMSEKEEKKVEEVKDITGDAQVEGRQADIYQIDMDHAAKVLSMQEDESKEESSAKTPTETKSKDKGKGIMVEEPKPMKKKQQVEFDEAYARKLHEELNHDIDWEVAIDHVKQKVKEDPFIQRYQVMKKRPQTEAQARRNMMMYLKNTVGFRLDYFKGMSYDDMRPIFKAKFNANMEFLLKSKEQIEEETNRALESINETPAQKAAKRRRRNEEVKDVE